jgi:hypothetical protein
MGLDQRTAFAPGIFLQKLLLIPDQVVVVVGCLSIVLVVVQLCKALPVDHLRELVFCLPSEEICCYKSPNLPTAWCWSGRPNDCDEGADQTSCQLLRKIVAM